MRGPIGIDGREYKLLLDPEAFPGAPSDKATKSFWRLHLKPLIEKRLGARKSGESRAKGELTLTKQRSVAFLDTKNGLLDDRHFSLRLRSASKNGGAPGAPEVTLKFRTPDFLLAAEYCRAARKYAGDTKLEEDIAPLQVARGSKSVAVADPPSVYSRFSVSTRIAFDGSFETLADAFDRFGALRESLALDGKAVEDARLVPGPTICEWVFQDAAVDLGEDLDAEFGFTLWYFVEDGVKNPWKRAASGDIDPGIAEISFDFDTKGGRMDAPAAKRASKLFIAMQEKLPVNPKATSKTALGLPSSG